MMLLTFRLDDWKCALPLSAVDRTHRAVAVTPLPGAPHIVSGAVNVRGTVLPVIDLRRRFGLPPKRLAPSDHLIFAHAGHRPVALVVDQVSDVVECPAAAIAAAGTVLPGLEYLSGIARLEDGMLLVHDLDRFLSLEEAAALDRAMEGA